MPSRIATRPSRTSPVPPSTRIAAACRSLKRSYTRARTIAALALILPTLAHAAALKSGDFVMVTWQSTSLPGCCRVVSLDGTSLTMSQITSDGYIADAVDIAVTTRREILVTVPTTGVVRVDPTTGNQTIFASLESLGGGAPAGILATGAQIYLTIQNTQPRIVQLDEDGSVARVVSSGGLLAYPAGLALGPDGALYVCETIPIGYLPGGSLIRVDPVSGTQTLIASGDPIHGPLDAAFAPDGSLWSVQWGGLLHEKGGWMVRTRISDGFSERVDFGFDFVRGLAIRPDGRTVIADCAPAHSSCDLPYAQIYPDGPRVWSVSGPVALVPDMATPATRTSWGRIKVIYR